MRRMRTTPPNHRGFEVGSSLLFGLSLAALVSVSVLAGAMLRPTMDRWRRPAVPSAGELALFLEHTLVDVRLGRAAPLAERLEWLAPQIKDPVTRERVLGLWTEAALQAGRLQQAASSEEQREAIAKDEESRSAIRLRRIGLAAALGRSAQARDLAKPLIAGRSSRLADEARLRLMTSLKEEELRSWVASKEPRDAEQSRRAGLAALRLLDDAAEAERLLAPLERSGPLDESLCQALLEVYSRLDRPKDLARVSGQLLDKTNDESERMRLVLLRARALARIGDAPGALAALGPLRHAREFPVRQTARRAYYEVLGRAGRLQAELTSLRDPAERAFVALEVEHDYAAAARLYDAATAAHPDSEEIAAGLREAQRRLDLAERRALYEQVLAKDPNDQATRDKLLVVLVALGEADAAREVLQAKLKGRETVPEALVAVALALKSAGLDREAAGYLEKAHAAESDVAKKQLILFSLGDLYAGARQDADAQRLYTSLAADGASTEIRERAVARLATLLH
jgi:tetratricopeptide (TPR) repeat protein